MTKGKGSIKISGKWAYDTNDFGTLPCYMPTFGKINRKVLFHAVAEIIQALMLG